MIVVVVVIGIAVALCVVGWVPVVRDALRPEHVLPGPPVREAAQALADAVKGLDSTPESAPEAVSA